MTLTATPSSYAAVEATSVDFTVVLTDVDTPPDPVPEDYVPTYGPEVVILSVTCADTNVKLSNTATTFTVTGMCKPAFPRTIAYLDSNNKQQSTPDISSVPEDYNAVFKYTPSPLGVTESESIVVTLQNHPTLIFPITVSQSPITVLNSVKDLISKGAF